MRVSHHCVVHHSEIAFTFCLSQQQARGCVAGGRGNKNYTVNAKGAKPCSDGQGRTLIFAQLEFGHSSDCSLAAARPHLISKYSVGMLQVDARLTIVLRSLEAFEVAYVSPTTLDASYGPDSLRRAKEELASLKWLDALLPRQRGTIYNMTAPLRRLSKECLQSLCQSLALVLSEGLDLDKQSLVSALVQFISTASISLPMQLCSYKQCMLVLQYVLLRQIQAMHAGFAVCFAAATIRAAGLSPIRLRYRTRFCLLD